MIYFIALNKVELAKNLNIPVSTQHPIVYRRKEKQRNYIGGRRHRLPVSELYRSSVRPLTTDITIGIFRPKKNLYPESIDLQGIQYRMNCIDRASIERVVFI